MATVIHAQTQSLTPLNVQTVQNAILVYLNITLTLMASVKLAAQPLQTASIASETQVYALTAQLATISTL